jgi:hypothetical protein
MLKLILIAFSTAIALFVIFALYSYVHLTNEVNKAPVTHDISDENRERVIEELGKIYVLSENVELISVQLFSDTRNPSALLVIKADDVSFEGITFYDASSYWSTNEKDETSIPSPSAPFIMINGKKTWPVEATETDPKTMTRLFRYQSFDNSNWLCISASKNIGHLHNIIRETIAKRRILYLLWR